MTGIPQTTTPKTPKQTKHSSALRILQWNMHNSKLGFHLLSQFLLETHYDIVLVQEPPELLADGRLRPHGYHTFLPSRDLSNEDTDTGDPLTLILTRASLNARSLHSSYSNRICSVLIPSSSGDIALLSVYIPLEGNQLFPELDSTLQRVQRATPFYALGLDTNGHSSWWGPPHQHSNTNGRLIEDFILTHHLIVHNTWPCPPTVSSDNGKLWINVTLSSPRLSPFLRSWRILEDDIPASDHSPIAFHIPFKDTPQCTPSYNWRATPWEAFRSTLSAALTHAIPSVDHIHTPYDLDVRVHLLLECFHRTIAQHVPIKHPCHYSNPWWTEKLAALRKHVTHLRRVAKATNSPQD